MSVTDNIIGKDTIIENSVDPFLRWAGGKNWLLKHIENYLPDSIYSYYEPFLGGASVFFYLKQTRTIPGEVVLSDTNRELINCYVQVRDNVDGVIEYLKTYKNEKDFYYRIRELVPKTDIESAAKFIYLNRTSFNGIYRVNLKGIYNVPYGFKEYKILFDYKNLRKASELLLGTRIISRDFGEITRDVSYGDFIFLDPPYTVAHGNNGFIKYNQKIFAWHDQERLADIIQMIINKGAYFVLTNAAHSSIDALFSSKGVKTELSRFSVIGGKNAKRKMQKEYVFCGFAQGGSKA
jgi:DNA adenine methylase